MAFIPVPDTAEVVMTFANGDGTLMKNVYNVREASILSWDETTLNALIDTFEDWENSDAKAQRSNAVTLVNITARDMTVANGAVVERSESIAGTTATAVLPANVTFAVKSVTGLAGRSFRGRTYWIGLGESQVAGNLVSVSVADAIQAALNALIVDLSFGSRNLVVVSRISGGVPRTTAVATDITSWQYRDRVVDTQRRRLT